MYPFRAAAPPCLYKNRASSCKSRSFCFKVASFKKQQSSLSFITFKNQLCIEREQREFLDLHSPAQRKHAFQAFPATLLHIITMCSARGTPRLHLLQFRRECKRGPLHLHSFVCLSSLFQTQEWWRNSEGLGNRSAARDLDGYRLIHAQNISWKERNSSTASQMIILFPPSSNWLKDTYQIHKYGIISEGERRMRLS